MSNDAAITLDDLRVLRSVAKAGGFRPAAAAAGLSASRLSEIVRRCEDRLGLRLFERSTRRVRPTDVLVRLLGEAEEPLDRLDHILDGVADRDGTPSGVLTIGAPVAAGPLFLDRLAARFLAEHPAVDVDLRYDDAVADPIEGGLDLVVRSEAFLLNDHHSVPVGPPVELSLVAAPDYLRRNGTPSGVDDLPGHRGICFRLPDGRLAPWIFHAGGAGTETVIRMPRPRATSDSQPGLVTLAGDGVGLALVYADAVRGTTRAGRLVKVRTVRPVALPGFRLAYLSKHHMPPKVRAFLDMAKGAPRTGSRD